MLILASASPRRLELLAQLGLAPVVQPADLDEAAITGPPEVRAEQLALAKARTVARCATADDLVLGADTIVVTDGQALGKPRDAADARAMLRTLRGRTHTVVTGVAVVRGSREAPAARAAADASALVATEVTMRGYSNAEIAAYVARGEPFDKAGGYAIQDPVFAPVARITGCWCAVMGLPLWTTRALLARAGIRTDAPVAEPCRACPLRPGV